MGLMTASGFCFLGAGLLGLLEWMDQFQLFRISRDAYLSAYPAALLPVLLLTVLLTFGSGAALLLVGRARLSGPAGPADLPALCPSRLYRAVLAVCHPPAPRH